MAKKYYAIDPSPATTFIPPQTLGRNLYGEVGINFDPDQARELLAQAGYQDASSFPKVTFIVNSYGNTAPGARFNMARAMADMWLTNLGVTVEVKALEPVPFNDWIESNPPELFWIGWLPGSGNDPNFIILTYQSGSEWNYGFFSNAEFDSLVGRAAAVHDPATRQGLYIEAERVLCEKEAGTIPLYYTFMNLP
jgi:ABC-type transport system substrate-binding protein